MYQKPSSLLHLGRCSSACLGSSCFIDRVLYCRGHGHGSRTYRECYWPGHQLLCSETHHYVYCKDVLLGCSQGMIGCRDTMVSPALETKDFSNRRFWFQTSPKCLLKQSLDHTTVWDASTQLCFPQSITVCQQPCLFRFSLFFSHSDSLISKPCQFASCLIVFFLEDLN